MSLLLFVATPVRRGPCCRMLLDLSRALSFFVGIVSLYWAGISAFFEPATGWNERLLTTLVRLSVSAGVCLLSGLLFTWPVKSRLRTPRSLMSALPMQLFFWGSMVIAILFVSSWYLDSYPCTVTTSRVCSRLGLSRCPMREFSRATSDRLLPRHD